MTWHQWHHTADMESRMGLSSAWAFSKAASSHSCQFISLALLGLGEKRIPLTTFPL